MPAHLHIKTALAGKNPRLRLHRRPGAVHFALAQVKRTRTAAHAAARPHAAATLLRIVVIAVLLAAQRQVTPDVHCHLMAAHLRPGQRRIATADDSHPLTGAEGRFVMRQAVTLLVALPGVGAGADRQPVRALAEVNTDAKRTPMALVFTAQGAGVLRRE